MSKKIFLICNAHLDPVWQWEWEEGAAEALSTFRIASKFCDEYDGFIFNHNEALLYRWIEEYEPNLFEHIKEQVEKGKWHIMGGWHLQPDCNLPSGEGFVRQIKYGRDYFKNNFGVAPTTAFNVDPFGHSRGLVQIMKKSGYDSYIIMRPSKDFLELPSDLFVWKGYDGSEITVARESSYKTLLGKAAEKIRKVAEECPDNDIKLCLWGVGNHGGGPSKKDLDYITNLIKTSDKSEIEFIHSTPEDFFKEVRKQKKPLPVFAGELNPWSPGCYSSMAQVKKKYRELENELFLTEKMVAAAELNGLIEWPKADFDDVLYDLLTVQFHDMLPGTSIQPSEEMALRMLNHGLEILSRKKAQAFFALSSGQEKASKDAIPIMVYNPYPYRIEGDFRCEMMLWDQNWENNFSMPQVIQNGVNLPTQCEKENSNIPLDWRKSLTFHATLEPMQMNRFDCKYTKVKEKPIPKADFEDDNYFYLKNQKSEIRINKKSGYLDYYRVANNVVIDGSDAALCIIKDNCDPWGMTVTSFTEKESKFKLLSDEEGSQYSGVDEVIPSVRCVENGEVRTIIEAVLGYNNSRAVIRYIFSKSNSDLKIDIRIQWAEIHKMLKFCIPTGIKNAECIGQVAYGEENYKCNGRENVIQKYVILKNDSMAIAVCNDSIYGASAEGNELYLTLLRSPAYCAHPLGDRKILPQDRFTPHMEQGERTFSFVLFADETNKVKKRVSKLAMELNQPPMVLSYFPSGEGNKSDSIFNILSDTVELAAFKKADNQTGYIIRLFNSSDEATSAVILSKVFCLNEKIAFKPYEIKTFLLNTDLIKECDLMENVY